MSERVVSRSDPSTTGVTNSPIPLTVVTTPRVDARDVGYAEHRMRVALHPVEEHLLFARLKLDVAGDPARARRALAQIFVDLDGDRVRAHVAARTIREAADLLERRLRHQLEGLAERRDARRHRGPESGPGEWRHGDRPTERPAFFDRPVAEREVVRHKSFATHELAVDEAAFEMDQLDYDFHLFRELGTGEDAVIERLDDGTFRLWRRQAVTDELGETAVPVAVEPVPAPTLTVAAAKDRLDADDERFVFFVDDATGRGAVLYRRYDGHYGLLSPE